MCDIMDVTGDREGENGDKLTEELELWWRDPVECIRELIGNPAYKEHMAYAPERAYQDPNGNDDQQIWDEMWTGKWWHDVQVTAA